MRFLKKWSIIAGAILYLTPLFSSSLDSKIQSTSIKYFTHEINLEYDASMMVAEEWVCMQEKCFKEFYKLMDKAPYQLLLENLQSYQQQTRMNDWFYFKMVQLAVDDILKKKDDLHKSYVTWFLLNKSGYDVRIAVTDAEQAFLYAYALETMGDVPAFTLDEKRYVNLTSIDLNIDSRKLELKKPKFVANKKGKGFTFSLEQVPDLPADPIDREIKFEYNDEEYTVNIKADNNFIKMLEGYPAMGDMEYLTASISSTAAKSLIPQLKKLVNGKTTKEGLEILVSFTRSGFAYKWDWNVYNDDQPMFAEQLLLSEFSDQEDRCALFYYLVKEIYDLPMMVATHYNNNMTIGVEWDEKLKRPFEHQGRQYMICDPTTPGRSSGVDRWPNGMTSMTTTVIGTYK